MSTSDEFRPATDWQALVTQFRPIYKLHSEESFYPVHVEDIMFYSMSLVKSENRVVKTVVPAWLTPDIVLATEAGLADLAKRGITLDAQTIADLRPKATTSKGYTALQLDYRYLYKRRPDVLFTEPYGFLWSKNYEPKDQTWYHGGAPNAPHTWLGPEGSRKKFAEIVASGQYKCAFKEPVIIAWVQKHTVAGVDYVDVIYTSYFSYNGSISLIAGQGEHFNDVVTNTVRFRANDLTRPVRYYFATMAALPGTSRKT